MFSRRLFRRRGPLIASVKLTHRCNLACAACPFHRVTPGRHSHMDWDTVKTSLARLMLSSCPIVVFEGGEPLLWEHGGHAFADAANLARGSFACVAATTNGTMPLDVPTDVLWVSVDGTKATHDELRSGSYDRVMENIRNSTHPRLYVHMTLNRKNWRELGQVARSVFALAPVKGMTVQLFYPYGLGEDDLALDACERRQAIEHSLALKERGVPILNSRTSLEAMARGVWRCRPELLGNIDPDGTFRQGCYAEGRGRVDCANCGFTPVIEASMAYGLHPGAMVSGIRIFV